MRVHTVTGGDRDFLELVPETIDEAAALVFAGTSKFVAPTATHLVVTPEQSPYLSLRVYLSEPRPRTLDRATRAAIDQTT